MARDEPTEGLLDRKIVANEVGIGLVEDTRAYLESLDARHLAEYLIGGLATADLTPGTPPAGCTSGSP